jgi:RHH-type proline utilization regulon transcriptional repressor/proline dehydrogenase/delta 1-pyrroline-5-carboxylate dehydrogenase
VADAAAGLEARIQALGSRLLASVDLEVQATQGDWLDALISHAIQDRHFRLQALRFFDVLPALQDNDELVAHLKDYFADTVLPWPAVSHWSLRHSDAPWAVPIAASLVRATLRGLSRRFMGGRTIRQALGTIRALQLRGMGYTLDMLGEAVVSEREADRYQQGYIELLRDLAKAARSDPESRRPHVSLKLSSLYSQIHPADPEGSVAAIAIRLRPILAAARAAGAAVTIDMEQYAFRHIVLQCFMRVLSEPEFCDWPDAGIAIQAYLKDVREDLQALLAWAARRVAPVQVRIVRGAYWDYEAVIARQHGWEVPVWEEKAQTDAAFEDCLALLMSRADSVSVAVASHNVRSLACAMALAESRGLSPQHYEFQMLYGMADELKQALVGMGYRLRVYVPFGETLPGMAYLVRRLLENSSGQSLLDSGMVRTGRQQASLEKPAPVIRHADVHVREGFANQPVHRFVTQQERTAFASAIRKTRERLGEDYPLIIGGAQVSGAGWITSGNPSRPTEVIGRVARADRALADQALAAALEAAPDWGRLPPQERAAWLGKIAAELLRERDRFAAWQVLEVGKNWTEADADVCEAIDFLNYYAACAERLGKPQVSEVSGEHNRLYYRPKGVGLVIAPWNFPLAILTGMLSATIVTGNTAILKPSSLSPVIAAQFMRLLHRVGLPPGVVNYLPGHGPEVGEYLAASPRVNVITFTGSRSVGTRLLGIGAQLQPGQTHIKRVIAEMGGKNAIIVDADADLDDAVPGVLQSAFGFQGQKCSAASRVIVVGKLHDTFVDRLFEAACSLTPGDPQQPGNVLGPVIDEAAYARIQNVIAQGKQRARLLTGLAAALPQAGHFMAPQIFTGVDPQDPLAQEEIFGPVLAVLRADDFGQALEIANATAYALTGGVYSRYPAHLDRARESFRVGNLYLNRGITGALVSRQPFGGFRLSGAGSKAGGPDSLLQYTDAVCVTENTLRRGFAPDIGSVAK